MSYSPPHPEPIHDDKGLNTPFWSALGLNTDSWPHTLTLDDGSVIKVWRNTIRDRSGRFDGYIVTYQRQVLVVRSRLKAASLVLITRVLDGAQIERIWTPAGANSSPGTWHVYDDALRRAQAERIAEVRRRNYPNYDFIVMPSQFHDEGFFQVEGRKR